MLQSVSGVLRLFPAWPGSMDGEFEGLRAYGAFIISGAYTAGQVGGFEVVSEKGARLRVHNPWPGQTVRCEYSGGQIQLDGEVLELDTAPGETYCFSRMCG